MSEATTDHRLLSVEEAARRLGASWATVRALIETGQLRAVTIGKRYRVPASALGELGSRPAVHQHGAPSFDPDDGGNGRNKATAGPRLISNRRALRG